MEKEARALLNGKAKKILIIEIWDAILEQSMCCTISKQRKYCCA
jgi:hypothetical protein